MRIVCFVLVMFFSLTAGLSFSGEVLPAGLQAGRTMFDAKQYAEAQEFFKNFAKENPENAEAVFYLGRSYYHSRQIEKAVASLEKAIKLDGEKADYHYLLGLTYTAYVQEVNFFNKFGIATKMKNAWNTALKLDPGHQNSLVGLINFYVQAPGFAGGSLKKAEKTMVQLQQQYPNKVFYSGGLIAEKKGRFDKANQIFHDAVEANKTPRSVLSLARYLYRNKHYGEAIDYLHHYLTMDLSWIDPIKGFAYYLLGDIYAEKKMNIQAKEAFHLAQVDNNDKYLHEMIDKKIHELNGTK